MCCQSGAGKRDKCTISMSGRLRFAPFDLFKLILCGAEPHLIAQTATPSQQIAGVNGAIVAVIASRSTRVDSGSKFKRLGQSE